MTVSANTDGIILQVEDTPEALNDFKNICERWCKRTKMGLGNDEIKWIWQKDVNNYCVAFSCQKDVDELESSLRNIYPNLKRDGEKFFLE